MWNGCKANATVLQASLEVAKWLIKIKYDKDIEIEEIKNKSINK